MANKPAKKKAAAKKPVVHPAPKTAEAAAALKGEFTAPGGCMNRIRAAALVFSCTGVGPVNVDTQLGVLFPAPVLRRNFCGCVFLKATKAGVIIQPTDIPCGEKKTIDNVIDSIAC